MATIQVHPDQISFALAYDERMKSKLDTDTTPKQKMQRFESALGRIMTVSKDELNRRIVEDEEVRRRTKGKPGPKPSSALGHEDSDET